MVWHIRKMLNMVSIIIPVYNTKIDDLQACLSSVTEQSVSELDILLIENGSKRECAEAVDRIAASDSRIRVFHTENKGVSVARNFGTKQALGDYIMYVDADDILESSAVEDGLIAAKKTGCDVIIGKICKTTLPLVISQNNKPNCEYIILESEDLLNEFRKHIFTKGNPLFKTDDETQFNGEGCWSHLIKREVAEELTFPEGVAVGEDTIWALNMIDKGVKICLSDKLWYYYIQNDYSVLSKYNPAIVEQLSQPVSYLNPKYLHAEASVYNAYMKWILSKIKQILFRDYFARENTLSKKEKKKRFRKMVSSSPWKEALRFRLCLKLPVRLRLFLIKHQVLLSYFKP